MIAVLLGALIQTDVLVSAGHEGRPASCARYAKRACNLGAAGEREWTPVVADEVARVLRLHGIHVVRVPADFDGQYAARAAIFIHFDGADKPCSSAASIGYPRTAANATAASKWRAFYSQFFPYGFEPDNFTAGLRDYYAYRQVETQKASMVLELGEITCPAQHAWLAPRLRFVGDLLAYYLGRLIGKGDVPLQSKFVIDR